MALAVILTCALALGAAAQQEPRFSFRGSGQMTESDIKQALGFEIESGGDKLVHFERELQDLHASLPKNAEGLVGHHAVRYALHRYFLHQHGWFIRGLEPGNASWTPERRADGTLPPAFVREWVPTFLQDTIERQGGNHGMGLRDMATMAVTLEDLVHKEVEIRLKLVYKVHGVEPEITISRPQGEEILDTYLMTFLLANNLTAKSKEHLLLKKNVWAKKFQGIAEVRAWYAGKVADRFGGKHEVDFQAASEVVHDLGEKFHTYNDIECNDLRATLRRVESKRPGRVRLSLFYNMSRFTRWGFTESAAWLKSLGALDDSDPKYPSVIIPNYVMGRPNCLEASNLFAICCRNTCEDLMAHIERDIGHSKATPARISTLVAALPSESVQAPRSLSPTLLERLDQVAAHHGGEVPLHGRLFAQWMHHAFPRECPYPHEAGTINPQTADEWMLESGQSSHATEEEMHNHIDNDVCAMTWEGNPDCGQEDADLPWSSAEELLSAPHVHELQRGRSRTFAVAIAALVMVILVVSAAVQKNVLSVVQFRVQIFLLDGKLLGVLAVLGLMFVAYSMDLLDGGVFALAFAGSVVMYMASLMSVRSKACADCKGCLPVHSKGF